MTLPGLDYAWSRPSIAALKATGARFVCRYLSPDTTKNLTRGEAALLLSAGISIVVVLGRRRRRDATRPGGWHLRRTRG